MGNKHLLEICAYNIQSCIVGELAGASRIELCSSPAEGGVTPGYGIIQYALENIAIPVFVMIRPRGGNFTYDASELSIMYKDIVKCKQMGCPGVVAGVLKADNTVDTEEMKRITELAYPMPVTFHKAFDMVPDAFQALEDVISSGCARILTSGLASTATEGARMLSGLNEMAADRIVIMPGGGIRSTNIRSLAHTTMAKELHSSAIPAGSTNNIADTDEIHAMLNALK